MSEKTYVAKSMWSDPTNLASLGSIFVGVLALPEVVSIIPLKAMPYILAVSGALSFVLRTFNAVRPVANIRPTETAEVQVKSLTITPPPKEE
jgi:hypothetical protein